MDEREEETPIPEDIISEVKLKKLKNLKYFREWSNDQIIEWVRNKKKDEVPPVEPPDLGNVPGGIKPQFDAEEYKKKFNTYLQKYKREYAVDMNDANDAEALTALVRYKIQLELINDNILNEQHEKHPNHQVLKGLGDFQRSVQMNINELQEKLGITRKARKQQQVDDFPKYVSTIQKKAKDLWNRKTVAVRCEKCHIELARYWLNFADQTKKVQFEIVCDKCKEEVHYLA
jgi:ribosomal protein L44E